MLQSIISRVKTYAQNHSAVFPALLLLETFICYGVMGFSSGFYWDDWPPVMLSNIARPGIFWASYADRPFSAWTYTVMFPLLQNSALAWQIANMLLRWAGVFLIYLVCAELFPKQRALFKWAALISLILPIFRFQYFSVAFSQHFLTYALFAGSLYLMVMSVKHPRRFWLFFIPALAMSAAHMFMMEYFVGLELLRPLVLFLALRQYGDARGRLIRPTLLRWLPYLAVLAGYVYWRVAIFPVTVIQEAGFSNTLNLLKELAANPAAAVQSLLSIVASDLRFSLFSSWLDRLWPVDIDWQSRVMWLGLAVGAAAAAIFFVLAGEKTEKEENHTPRAALRIALAGLVVIFLGTAPVWSALRSMTEGKYAERFALAAIPGIALVVTAAVWSFRSARLRSALLLILVTLSMGFQINFGNDVRKDYLTQQNIYSQLKWRMPQLKEGTAVYSPTTFSNYEADYSYSMGLNVLYDSEITTDLDYWFFTPRYYEIETLLNDPGLELEGVVRGPRFTGTAGNIVAVYTEGTGCVLVLDPVYAALKTNIDGFDRYGSLTNFVNIVDNGETEADFPQAFGSISSSQWCYYFEKADLARQNQDWERVITLYDEAAAKGFHPIQSVEYIPLIHALAAAGEVDRALDVTRQAIEESLTVVPPACALWSTLVAENSSISSEQVSAALGSGTCPQFK